MTGTLADIQKLFWTSMRGPAIDQSLVDRRFRGSASLSAAKRIRIYRGMYWARQFAALLQDFPRVATALGGERDFRDLAHEYLLAFPSEDPRLEFLGQHLPQFLRTHANVAWAACADLATFEWAQVAAFVAPDPLRVVDRWELAVDESAGARLTFVPSLQLLRLDSDPNGAPAVHVAPLESRLGGEPACVAVWRKNFHVFSACLTPEEFGAARAARDGATFAEMCCAFAEVEDAEARAAATLAGWLSRGWVSGATPGGDP